MGREVEVSDIAGRPSYIASVDQTVFEPAGNDLVDRLLGTLS